MEVRPQEQRLIDLADDIVPGRVLCNTVGRAQLAAVLAGRAETNVTCWLLDLYQLQQAQLDLAPLPANLHLVCQADPPAGDLNSAALCFSRQGEAELAREILQTAHERLMIGGRLAAAIDNPADQWLHELLRGHFDKVTRRPLQDATIYLATKTRPPKKIKDYSCELAFRDVERLVHLRTRPGVFSHREVDGGARALIKSMEVLPGIKVLDLGCGSGAVGIAAALRADAVRVYATDSNPRAIEAALWAADRNALSDRVTAALDSDGSTIDPGTFDLVLANPPYFSNFRIAGLFLTIAHRALVSGGRLLVVTKTPDWYRTALAKRFEAIEDRPIGQYHVVHAIRS